MTVRVDTPVFSGPFDLLLHLITQRQVDVYEVRLAEIVDAYLAEIEKMEELDLEVTTEFLLIAATLVELKSLRLLPHDEEIDLDEELSIYERRDLLIARLLDAKTFKDASKVIQVRFEAGRLFSPRVAGIEEPFLHLCPDLFSQVGAERFAEIAANALRETPPPVVDTRHIHQVTITVAEVMRDLAEILETRKRSSFRDLTVECASKIEVAVHFLALLELYKQNMIDLEQFTTFGEITVIWAPSHEITDWSDAAAEWDDEPEASAPDSRPAGRRDSDGRSRSRTERRRPWERTETNATEEKKVSEDPAIDAAELAGEIARELDLDLEAVELDEGEE